jgi:hypothetical protein
VKPALPTVAASISTSLLPIPCFSSVDEQPGPSGGAVLWAVVGWSSAAFVTSPGRSLPHRRRAPAPLSIDVVTRRGSDGSA